MNFPFCITLQRLFCRTSLFVLFSHSHCLEVLPFLHFLTKVHPPCIRDDLRSFRRRHFCSSDGKNYLLFVLYEPQYCCYPTVTELSRSKECWSSRSHINVSFLTFCMRILTAPFTLARFVRTSKINIDTRKKGRELSRQKNVVSGRSSTVNAVEPEALRRICFLSALLYITCCSELYFSTCSNSSAVSSILQQFLIKAPSTRILK